IEAFRGCVQLALAIFDKKHFILLAVLQGAVVFLIIIAAKQTPIQHLYVKGETQHGRSLRVDRRHRQRHRQKTRHEH
ncbi:MAG: hypothetical protein LUE89_08955, partial [Clostridiales bacterium]|nr:hypothetical protein [Clostridiales bacterium]